MHNPQMVLADTAFAVSFTFSFSFCLDFLVCLLWGVCLVGFELGFVCWGFVWGDLHCCWFWLVGFGVFFCLHGFFGEGLGLVFFYFPKYKPTVCYVEAQTRKGGFSHVPKALPELCRTAVRTCQVVNVSALLWYSAVSRG